MRLPNNAMRCKLCRRVITDAESIRQGIGPTCRGRLAHVNGAAPRRAGRQKQVARAVASIGSPGQGELFDACEAEAL